MSDQIPKKATKNPAHLSAPLAERQLKRATRLRTEADNCIALVLNSETRFAGELIDEAIMLSKRARELSQQ